MNSKRNKVLAIGLDAASPAFVRNLIERGEMPNLKKLLSKGRWMRVDSTAHIGSGSVWPTFITGKAAGVHGVYGEWVWQPQTMDLVRYSGNNLPPFWQDFEEHDLTVGILDLPFMPLVGLSNGFEISEWGPHDVIQGKTCAAPADISRLVESHAKHPLAFGAPVSGPHDYSNLQKLGQACLDGARIRGTLARELITKTNPDFCLIVFPETHRCGHYLWHTAEADHALYSENGFANLKSTKPTLTDLYQEIDEQIGEIVKTLPEDSAIMVFSLHGMQPCRGVPAFLGAVLMEAGFTRLTDWGNQNWKDRARTVVANIKKLLPEPIKKIYYSIVPATTAHLVARSTLLPQYDWRRTRAFALPTDQHGWIRVNLKGRESQGIVRAEDYEKTCDDLEKLVRELTSEDGRPLARKIMRTATRAGEAFSQNIPDLIIHWDDAVFATPLKIKGLKTPPDNIGMKYVGQHALDGFCILSKELNIETPDPLAAKDMGALIATLLGVTTTRSFSLTPRL